MKLTRATSFKVYGIVASLLVIGAVALQPARWRGSTQIHTLMELMATLVALFAGTVALLRHFSRPSNCWLFLGVGFIGTAFLDGYHAVVTSSFFREWFPSPPPSLIPWSWNASRTFLAVLMTLTWWMTRRERQHGEAGRIGQAKVFVGVGLLTLCSFCFFAFVPLPRAYYPEFFFGRPEEFVAAFFFLVALIGFLMHEDLIDGSLEHWLVISLIVAFVSQAIAMSRSFMLFDSMFDLAHILKILGYLCVLVGLIQGNFQLWVQAERHAAQTRRVIEASSTGMLMVRHDGTIVFVNSALESLFGYRHSELLGHPVERLLPESLRERHVDFRESFFRQPQTRAMAPGTELLALRSDGTQFPVEVALSSVETEDGMCALASVLDISERKQKDARREQLLAVAFGAVQSPLEFDDAGPAPVIADEVEVVVSPESENPFHEALRIFARQARISIGAHQSAVSYLPDGDFAAAFHTHSFSTKYESYNSYDVMPTGKGIWSLVVETKKPVRMTQDELTSHSAWRNFSDLRDERGLEHPPMRGWLAVPFLSSDSDFVGVVQLSDKFDGDFTDDDLQMLVQLARLMTPAFALQYANNQISRRVEERTAELKEANEDLARSNRELDEFAYVASHDLKAPLRGISHLAEWLRDDVGDLLPEKSKEHLSKLEGRVVRIDRLLDDLLAYSRAGRELGDVLLTDLAKLVESVVSLLEIPDAFEIIVSLELPAVTTHRVPLEMVFRNVIENAIKHHDRKVGRVVISGQHDGEFVRIAVSDDGPGIAPEFHERALGMFQTLRPRSEVEGSGMGMAIVRKTVEAQGGEVSILSGGGRGTTVEFTWKTNPAGGNPNNGNQQGDEV